MKILNQLRIDAGFSIADLASMMEVDQEVVCSWLCGSGCPAPEQIDRLASIFAVDTRVLLPCLSRQSRRGAKLRVKIAHASGRIRIGDSMNRIRPGSG